MPSLVRYIRGRPDMAVQRFAERMLSGEPIKKVCGANPRPSELPSSVVTTLIGVSSSAACWTRQFGSGESFRDYVFVEDVARAFTRALFPGDKSEVALVGRPQIYNIAGVALIRNNNSHSQWKKQLQK